MLNSGGLGHETKHKVNQAARTLTGIVYDNVRLGAIYCASDRSVLLKSCPKKSCCRIYSAVIFASCSFLTVRSGRPTRVAKSQAAQPVWLMETSHHRERKIPTCRRLVSSVPRPVCWQPPWWLVPL